MAIFKRAVPIRDFKMTDEDLLKYLRKKGYRKKKYKKEGFKYDCGKFTVIYNHSERVLKFAITQTYFDMSDMREEYDYFGYFNYQDGTLHVWNQQLMSEFYMWLIHT